MPSLNLIGKIPQVAIGLVTFTHTIGATGLYNVTCFLTEIPPSGISVVINNNGSPVFTAPALGQTQSAIQFKAGALQFAASDVITVVIASSSAKDQLLNSVKSTVTIQSGAF